LAEVRLRGAKAGDSGLQDLEIPSRHVYVLEGMPGGAPYNVGQMYYQFGQAIKSGAPCEPNFDTAVDLHRFLDAIRESSDQGRQAAVPSA
jgi:predicted dehydrogenase